MPDRITDIHSLPVLHELGTQFDEAFARNEDRGLSAAPGNRPPQRRRGALLSLVGVGAAVAVAAIVIVGVRTEHRASPATAAAAQALQSAAQAAGRSNAPVPRDDQFFNVRTSETMRVAPASSAQAERLPKATIVVVRRSWTSITRPGRREDMLRNVRFLTASDQAKWERAGRPLERLTPAIGRPMTLSPLRRYTFPGGAKTRQQLIDLPDSPEYLARLMGADTGASSQRLLRLVSPLLSQPLPAHVQAGLYRAIALVPGLRFLGATRDELSRRGVAVAAGPPESRLEFIFDPNTGAPLAQRQTARRVVLNQTVLIRRAVVNAFSPCNGEAWCSGR